MTQVVVDNGSDTCKTEFAGEVASRAVIPPPVDKPKVPGIMVGMEEKDSNVGDDVQSKRGVWTVKHHIQHAGNGNGIVVCASVGVLGGPFLFLVTLSFLLSAGPKCQASWTRKTVVSMRRRMS